MMVVITVSVAKKYNVNDDDKLERVQELKKDKGNGNVIKFASVFNLIIAIDFGVSPLGQEQLNRHSSVTYCPHRLQKTFTDHFY